MATSYYPFTAFDFPDISTFIGEQQNSAEAAATAATAFLTDMSDWITGVDEPLSITELTPVITAYTTSSQALTGAPTLPAEPDITGFDTAYGTMPEMVTAPSAITVTGWNLGDLESYLGTLPLFNVTRPTINYPNAPQTFTETAPDTDIGVITSFVFPDAPVLVFPSIPDLNDYTIPTLDNIVLPNFNMNLPDSIHAPITELSFNWTEDPYSSSTLTAVTANLLERLAGGATGLPPSVEQAIWDRSRDREEASAKRLLVKIATEEANRGYQRPQGSYFAAMQNAYKEMQNKISEMNREIFIKQADMEQENLKFAVTSVISLEQVLTNVYNQRIQRQFDAAKYAKELAVNVMNLRLQKLTIEKDIYNSYIAGYNARIQGALAEVEKFKAEVEVQKVIADINKNLLDAYNATLQGLQTTAQIYKTEVDAVSSRIQAESLKIQNLQAQIQEYTALINAKRMEYENYGNQISAENTKLAGFETDIKAFNERLASYASLAGIYGSETETDIKTESLRIEQYKQKLDYTNQYIQQWTAKINAVVAAYEQSYQLHKVRMDAQAEELRLAMQDKMNKIERDKVEAGAIANATQITIENAKNSAAIILESYKTGATVQSQIASGAMSSIHVGSSLNGQTATQFQYSETNDIT
jgi:hypothetical protein